MSAIEQFISGLVDERLDRGVRAVSWLLGCAYVLTLAWLPSHDINATTAIEASAIIGAFRGLYVLWMKHASRSHRLHSLHSLITKCRSLMDRGRSQDSEFLVSILVLRDELAKLRLGLPKKRLLAALESLQAYAQEQRWDLANNHFPISRYGHTIDDRREVIASIGARHASDLTTRDEATARLIGELKAHEYAMARLRWIRVLMVSAVTVALVTLSILGDRWFSAFSDTTELMQYLLIGSGVLAGLAYAWSLRPGYPSALSKKALESSLEGEIEDAREALDQGPRS